MSYYETAFDLAATIQDVVSEEIRFVNEGRVPADQLEELRKRNNNRLSEASSIYERAAATLEAMQNNPKPKTSVGELLWIRMWSVF